MTPHDFVETLAHMRFPDAFNPYCDACPHHDADDAVHIRKTNLKLVLQAALSRGVESIWIARDLGYRGGRRTGLALTDEAHLAAHSGLYGALELKRATLGPVMVERTATVIWQVLQDVGRPIFLWNVFPFHPHEPDDPLSNRCHSRHERLASSHLIQWLVSELQPRTLVAIGRDAQSALADLRLPFEAARHPSYGGQREFLTQMERIYSLPQKRPQQTAFDMPA